MALSLTEEANTEEDEAVANVVEVNLKQRASIVSAKGKQRDQSKHDLGRQQSDREPILQIIVGLPADQFFQCRLFNNNLALTTRSLMLIVTCSMSATISRLPMIGLVMRFHTRI